MNMSFADIPSPAASSSPATSFFDMNHGDDAVALEFGGAFDDGFYSSSVVLTTSTHYHIDACDAHDSDLAHATSGYRRAATAQFCGDVERLCDLDSQLSPDLPLFSSVAKDAVAPVPAKKAPLFVIDTISSPLSPSSYKLDDSFATIPEKLETDSFFDVHPSFQSNESPARIMETLEKALGAFECKFAATNKWRLVVSFLCAAEEVAFTIQLAQSRGAGEKYHIEFLRTSGDEAMFVEIVEAVRAHCADIDNDPMLFLASKSLSAWLDGKQDLTGRRYAIKSNEASILIQEMNADLHVDTLYHVARTVKNHCRHKGNRQLFMDADRKALILGLKWMLSDSDELARYAMFILLQFAKDQTNGDSEGSAAFWSSPCERSDCVLLLDMLAARDDTADFGASWTKAMAHELQQSLIMAL